MREMNGLDYAIDYAIIVHFSFSLPKYMLKYLWYAKIPYGNIIWKYCEGVVNRNTLQKHMHTIETEKVF